MSCLFYILGLFLVIAGAIIFFQNRQITRLKADIYTASEHVLHPGAGVLEEKTPHPQKGNDDFKIKLISLLAHDFRGAFMNIISLMEFYKKGEVPPDRFDALFNEMKETSKNNLLAFENTLKWVKTQLQDYSYNPLEIRVSDLIQKSIKNNLSEIKRKEISLSIQGDNEDWVVYADPQLLGFVMNNLLHNAIKYSFQGGKVECIIGRDDAKPEEMIKVEVVDYGVGMDAQTKEAIFCHDKTIYTGTQGEKGAGIGLLICKDFIEIQQGNLDVISETGKGAVFILRVPGKLA